MIKVEKKETIVIVHGTFAQIAKWHQPNSKFCRQLDQELAELGSSLKCWQGLGQHRHGFGWDGENSERSRTAAAIRVGHTLKYLLSEKGFTKIHIIAHSHGGNVILKAIEQVFRDEEKMPLNVILLGSVDKLSCP